jgi:predicted phage tail protein
MATVLLYGHLAARYGKRHKFDVLTPGEAIRAMRANYPDFEQIFLGHSGGYHVFSGYEAMTENGFSSPTSPREVIRVVPSVSGSGIETIATWIFVNTALSVTAAWVAAVVVTVAINAALAGISATLFAPEKREVNERPENTPSYIFNGAVNTTAQGNAVPVGYGRLIVGSQVVSAGFFTSESA